jgi:hypothetical protein
MIVGRSLFMRRIDFIMLEKNMKGKQIIENTRNNMRSFQKNEKCDSIYKDLQMMSILNSMGQNLIEV